MAEVLYQNINYWKKEKKETPSEDSTGTSPESPGENKKEQS